MSQSLFFRPAARPVLMKMSDSYDEQSFCPSDCDVLDLRGMEGTCCYCAPSAADALRAVIAPYHYGTVHWIDSGDYHYLTLFWMEKIDRPFGLLLLDNHSDDQPVAFDESLLSCGSWVKKAVETLPQMVSVCHIRNRTDILSFPAGLPVYVSLDKDVMMRGFARTDWDQGELSLDDVMGIISSASLGREILGVDVCGELSSSKGACGEDVEINLRTNMLLENFLLPLSD